MPECDGMDPKGRSPIYVPPFPGSTADKLFNIIVLIPGDDFAIDYSAAAQVLDVDEAEIEDALATLVKFGYIEGR